MKQVFIFLLTSFCFVSVTMNAQRAFQYDTIRTPNGKAPMYGTPAFRYDTIRNKQPASLSRKPTGNRISSSGNSASKEIPKPKSSFNKKNLFFGGSFGLQFGDYTLVDISPQIGYAFNRYVSAGLGISYTYMGSDYYTRNYAGLNIFGRFYPISNIVLSVQPEINSFWGTDNGQKYSSQTVPALLLGGGLRIPAGSGGVLMMIQYDIVQDKYSPYGNNIFYTVGYSFGF